MNKKQDLNTLLGWLRDVAPYFDSGQVHPTSMPNTFYVLFGEPLTPSDKERLALVGFSVAYDDHSRPSYRYLVHWSDPDRKEKLDE